VSGIPGRSRRPWSEAPRCEKERARSVQTTQITRTSRLLACGIVAGPLFISAALIQAAVRDGYQLSHHPISLLALGSSGWIQIANFVITGALYVACAVGMRRADAGIWGPRLIGTLGAGLILAGVFVTDAGAGFPPGAPEGAPEMSWHGVLHEVGFSLAFGGGLAGCLVFARRFATLEARRWAGAAVATPIAVLVIAGWPDLDSLSVRLVIDSAVLLGFVAATAARLMRRPA